MLPEPDQTVPDEDVEFDQSDDAAPVVVPAPQPEQVPDDEVDQTSDPATDEGTEGL